MAKENRRNSYFSERNPRGIYAVCHVWKPKKGCEHQGASLYCLYTFLRVKIKAGSKEKFYIKWLRTKIARLRFILYKETCLN